MEIRDTPESSHISGIGYISSEKTLFVEFKGVKLYRYYDVNDSIYDEMKVSPSKGKFFNQCVRGKFMYEQVEGLLERETGQLEFMWR